MWTKGTSRHSPASSPVRARTYNSFILPNPLWQSIGEWKERKNPIYSSWLETNSLPHLQEEGGKNSDFWVCPPEKRRGKKSDIYIYNNQPSHRGMAERYVKQSTSLIRITEKEEVIRIQEKKSLQPTPKNAFPSADDDDFFCCVFACGSRITMN